MREQMASFFESQLDFIYFFYGLAFILLGVLCIGVARSDKGKAISIAFLGWFGLLHGISEWLDLATLIVGDSTGFAIVRIALMTISFMSLTEWARRGFIRAEIDVPGPWIYVPLLLPVIAAGALLDLVSANAMARYIFAGCGGFGAGLMMIIRGWRSSHRTRTLTLAVAVVFVLYGIAAAIMVPAAPFWPAQIINQTSFVHLTGIPIQLVRGLIACALAIMIWAGWGVLLAEDVNSERYSHHLRQQFVGTLAVMGMIFIGGWFLTNFLGGIYSENIQDEAKGDIGLLSSRLSGESAIVDAIAKVLAHTPSVQAMLSGPDSRDAAPVQRAMEVGAEAAGATVGHLLNAAGDVIVSSNPREFALLGMPNQSQAPWFRDAASGLAGRHFAFENTNGARMYYGSYPVRNPGGAIVGSVVLEKSLDALEVDLREFDRPFFFVDRQGVVVMTNRPGELRRTLWPSPVRSLSLDAQFGAPAGPPLLEREVTTSGWVKFDGIRSYVVRTPIGDNHWSMVIAIPAAGISASRFLGIVITLQFAITALFYFFGREHGIRESIQQQQRRELQDQATTLQVRASTDPLTGIYNRLRFDEDLHNELLRARRSQRIFSVVLYDIDHFKAVNDAFGHLIGDQVLVQVSNTVAGCLRETDLLARWGGEEFAILLADTSGRNAWMVAEKIRDAIVRTPFGAGPITCSFGVAQSAPGDTAESMVARADNALYRAKMNGRNRVELDTPIVEATELAPLL